MKQPVEQVVRVERDQFFRRGGLRQRADVRPCVAVGFFFGQALHQKAAAGVVGSGQGDVGVELFGAFHVVHQHVGDAAAFEGDDALPLFAVFGLQRQGEDAVVAQEIGQAFVRADFGLFVPAGGSAHGVFGSGFDHQHFQTALSLYLYGQRAVGFQVARQQYACRQ